MTSLTVEGQTLAQRLRLVLDGQNAPQTVVSLTDFTQRIWRGYIHTPYQAMIDAKLEAVADYIRTGGASGIPRLMIFVPPRHGKTQKVSRIFPAWILGGMPDTRLITTSYGARLAERNSRSVRNIIRGQEYQQLFPRVGLSRDTKSVGEWDIEHFGGGMIAAGVGGAITGHGAQLIIIDDPVKSRAEAESPTYRQRAKDWYTDDLSTRLEEPGGAMVVIQTRWHQDDLSGWLLNEHPEADSWDVLNLPALARDDDPLGREPGQALWPERYGVDWLTKRQESMGEYSFAALYQQNPIPSGGGLFDSLCISVVDDVPPCTDIVRFYDLAITQKRTSDFTVGLKLGVTDKEEFVILHMYRDRREAPDIHEAIIQHATLDGPGVPIHLEAEKAGIIEMQYILRDERLRPFTVQADPPVGDKYTRAGPVASRVNYGRVLMVRAPWNQVLLDELAAFPNAAHDDIVDALSGAYTVLANPTGVFVG